ncbi:MAG: hypothetical protein ACKVP7_03900 [Hyphomicrobiaceae bacterium]
MSGGLYNPFRGGNPICGNPLDVARLRSLFTLPRDLAAQAEAELAMGRSSYARLIHQEAVALALMIRFPMRGSSLITLRTDEHLVRDHSGQVTALSLQGGTGWTTMMALDREASQLITRHVQAFRPGTRYGTASRWLFPSPRYDAPRSLTHLDHCVSQRVQEATGVTVRFHMLRHVIVALLIDEGLHSLCPERTT